MTLVGGVLVHLVVAAGTGDAAPERLAGSLLTGQVVAATWMALALVANPLSYPYLRDHLTGSSWYEPVAPTGQPHPVTGELERLGLRHSARAVPTESDDDEGFDLLVSTDGALVAAVGRGSGSLSVMSRLSDGRIAHTTDMLVVPTEQMVVNTTASGASRDVVKAHAVLLGDLAARDVVPVPATPRLWLDALSLERRGYEQLGPVVASLCNPSGAPTLGRLMVTVPAADVRALSVTPTPTAGRPTLGLSRS